MKRNSFGVVIFVLAVFLWAPESRADGPARSIAPEDYSVSLDLKFTKKNADGYRYLCLIHGGLMTGRVTVK